MRFNPDKCIFRQDSISFYGVTLSKDGVKPNPQKIQAIRQLPEPKTEALLQSFLGMVNYLSRFSRNIAKLTINLRGLLKKGTEFIWKPQHSKDFQTIIHELYSPKLLKYYNSNKDLYLEVDASQRAIGMALLQSVDHDQSEAHYVNKVDSRIDNLDNKPIPNDLLPVAYGSKTLTEAESWYANIERELLGVVARWRNFIHFVMHILSDHKPLSAIVRKDLVNAPPILQRLLL